MTTLRDLPLEQQLVQPDPGYDVVFPDDASDFLYPLDPELPEPARMIGVKVSSEVKQEMERIIERTIGSLYQARGFRGLYEMLDLFRGPLEGIGLVENKRLIAQILSRARVFGWSWRKTADAILRLCQHQIRYSHDEESKGFEEYGRYPLETLLDGEGDCECHAILCCALLAYCGYTCALVLVPGHAMAAVLRRDRSLGWFHRTISAWMCRRGPWPLRGFFVRMLGGRFLYGETTGGEDGWVHPTDDSIRKIEALVIIRELNLAGEDDQPNG